MSKEEEIEEVEAEEKEEKKRQKKAKKSKDSGIVLSMWIFAALVVLILCVTNYQKVKKTMEETQFIEKISGSKESSNTENKLNQEDKKIQNNNEEIVIDLNAKRGNNPFENVQSSTQKSDDTKVSIKKPVENEKVESKKEEIKVEVAQKNETKLTEKKNEPSAVKPTVVETKPVVPPVKPVEKSVAKLYFVSVSDSGKISKKYIERSIVKNDSPLTNNLNLLFAGPVGSEKNSARSLIPANTKLKGITISNGVAKINLSEDFEYNSYGMEGYQSALMQIVYTATEFSTVNSVQFLIEGQKKDYLGSEGCWIGSPLSRSSF